MNATDAFFGIMTILLLIGGIFLYLNHTSLSNTVSNLAVLQANQQILFSPGELCKKKEGVELVREENLENEEYFISAGTKNNQRFFCFYKKSQ